MSIGKKLESKEENAAPENKWPQEKKTQRIWLNGVFLS